MALGLEPVVFVVRAGPEYRQYGDPYTSSGMLTINGDRAFLAGVRADEIWPYRSELMEVLARLEVGVLEGHRLKSGRLRKIEVRVR